MSLEVRPRQALRRNAVFVLALLVAGCAQRPFPPTATASATLPARQADMPADTTLPPGAARALAQRLPGLRPLSHGAGRLQVDDADDLAVVLAPPGRPGEALVAVLAAGTGGAWRVAGTSRIVSPGCETCTVTVDIAHHLLSLHVARPADADFERSTWQFGYRGSDDGLRLVGVSAAQPAGDEPIAHARAVSTDLLTGAKLDSLDPTRPEPGHRRELRSSVALRKPIAFDACSFDFAALAPEFQRPPATAFETPAPLPAAVAELLRTRLPGLAVRSRASGALGDHGQRDHDRALALVLAPARAGAGTAAGSVVALLQAQGDDGWRLAAVSGAVTGCPDCDVEVRIAHKALVVQTSTVDGGATRIDGWQFTAAAPDRLQLVGLRSVRATRAPGADSRREIVTANLATGDRLAVTEDVVHGRRTRSEHASQEPVGAPQPFAGFVFEPAR